MDRQSARVTLLWTFALLLVCVNKAIQELLVCAEVTMFFWPGFWLLFRDPSSWVLVQHSWISLAVKCIEGTQVERRAWLAPSAGFLEVSNYFFSELGCFYLVVRRLNFVSFLVRPNAEDWSIADSICSMFSGYRCGNSASWILSSFGDSHVSCVQEFSNALIRK